MQAMTGLLSYSTFQGITIQNTNTMVKGCAGFRGSTHAPVENETVPVENETVPVDNPGFCTITA